MNEALCPPGVWSRISNAWGYGHLPVIIRVERSRHASAERLRPARTDRSVVLLWTSVWFHFLYACTTTWTLARVLRWRRRKYAGTQSRSTTRLTGPIYQHRQTLRTQLQRFVLGLAESFPPSQQSLFLPACFKKNRRDSQGPSGHRVRLPSELASKASAVVRCTMAVDAMSMALGGIP